MDEELSHLNNLVSKWTTPRDMFALDSVNETNEQKELERLTRRFENLDLCIGRSREEELCSIAELVRGRLNRPNKKMKSKHLRPIVFMRLNA